jgi:ATP-binding cassette subfamily F protein 3
MIRFENLALRRGTKLLFSDATLQIAAGEHVGLVGDNGSGKSSLFALLRGELHADAGDLLLPAHWRIAHVAQQAPAGERPAAEFVIDGDRELRALERALADAEARHDGHAAGELHARLADHDAYRARSRAESLLLGLGFRPDELERPVSSFSGGWRMRLALAQTLMQPAELLLLDEPTNHLDLDAIVWLEDWLARHRGTLIVISHDRDFLDATTTVTLHLDGERLARYGGSYSRFERERALRAVVQHSAYQRQQREIAHLQSFIERFRAKASKARQAQSRLKALDRMVRIAPAHAAAPLHFEFATPAASPNPMLVLDAADCGYPGHRVLAGVRLTLAPGQRIGLLGANGQGKTTLIRTLAGELAPLAGRVSAGRGLAIGYFAQHEIERLRQQDSPLEHLVRLARELRPEARELELRAFLGSFDFTGERALAPVAPLSGGEQARLALALIVFRRPNLLLLDEPTNHLDLETRAALAMALASYEGTLVVVSHDRHLLRTTADEFLLVADGRVAPFDGDLDDYRAWLEARGREAAGGGAPAAAARAPKRREQRRERAAGQDRVAALRRPIERAIAALETRVERLSAERRLLEARLADGAIYAPERRAELAEALRRQAEVRRELDAAEREWLERHEALQALG